jgi:mRNA interferase RelE/StbE
MAGGERDADYTITFARSARKELVALPGELADRLLIRIERLARSPRQAGIRKLSGSENLWRLRVGDYRVIYSIDDQSRIVDVIAVRHRSDAYR